MDLIKQKNLEPVWNFEDDSAWECLKGGQEMRNVNRWNQKYQLRLVVFPISYKVLYIQPVVGNGISEPSTGWFLLLWVIANTWAHQLQIYGLASQNIQKQSSGWRRQTKKYSLNIHTQRWCCVAKPSNTWASEIPKTLFGGVFHVSLW